MKVVLELQDQPANVRRVMVRHDIVIGRGSDCNLRLSAPQVSRRHCFLRVGREGVSVTDLDSSNGTFVDGKRIKSGKRQELANGSSLSLGPIRFVIHIREEVVSVDLRKSAGQNKSSREAAENSNASDTSTTAENVAGFLTDGSSAAIHPLDISIEQGGIAAEANESTIKGQSGSAGSVTGPIRIPMPPPELMDSRAEIIDLGRQIAEVEGIAAGIEPPVQNSDSLPDSTWLADDDVLGSESSDDAGWSELIADEGESMEAEVPAAPDVIEAEEGWGNAEPFADAEIDENSEVQPVAEVDVLDEFDELQTEDIQLTDDIEEFVDVEEIAEAGVTTMLVNDGTDADGIATVPEVPETEGDGDGTWFNGEFKDNDDIDPDLQTFLKGF